MTHSPRSVALVLALMSLAGSSAVHAQTTGRDHHLTVSVTVSPICTVAVTPGEQSADEAVDVQCRNLAEGQPEPEIDDAGPAIEDGSTGIRTRTLNGKSVDDNYEVHFMVTQGMRDRKTLRVSYPMANKGVAGEVNPARQQIDFYIRSPQQNPKNTTSSGTLCVPLLQQGESLSCVKEQVGHASIQITADVYGHLVPGGNREAVDRLDDLRTATESIATHLQIVKGGQAEEVGLASICLEKW